MYRQILFSFNLFFLVLCLEVASGTYTDFDDPQRCSSTDCGAFQASQNEIFQSDQEMMTPCTTPNGENAYCIEIQDCPVLYNQLTNRNSHDFLRASGCGPRNQDLRRPKVCCGTLGNYRSQVTRNPLPKSCGKQTVPLSTRLLGGEEAVVGEFPWMALIIRQTRFGYKSVGCTGFIIHTRYILTAAHCIDNDLMAESLGPIFEVELGEHHTETDIDCNQSGLKCADPVQRIRIQEAVAYPKYSSTDRNHHHDIGLIRLKKSIVFSDYVQPICLPTSQDMDVYEYWLSGWGKTESSNSSPVKLKVSVPPVSLAHCVNLYRTLRMSITSNQVCAGGVRNRDSCTGDSGGPLMYPKNSTTWYAAGIVSFGFQCGREGWPGVYTNIPSYINWIKRQILQRVHQGRNSNRRPKAY